MVKYILAGANNGKTTTLIDSIQNGNIRISYTYDEAGNIKTISENGVLRQTYTYDNLNQLIRHDDAAANKSYTYGYDAGGNIRYKNVYAYTIGTLGYYDALSSYTFNYLNSNWKDLLSGYTYGSTTFGFTYDNCGNPTSYARNILTWQNGRELASFKIFSSGDILTYQYNDAGNRTKKVSTNAAGTVKNTTEYILNADKIVRQTTKNISGTVTNTMDFCYDENGEVYGFYYNNTPYYYIRNAQSDIIGIVSETGATVVQYTYDAWGKLLSTTGSLASTVGKDNPFRFKSYYYDTENGMYYLQNRYYDPVFCRFLNSDDTDVMAVNQDHVLEYNLFAYCLNNPVNNSDSKGNFALALAGGGYLATGATVGGANAWNPVGWAIIGVCAVGTGITLYKSRDAIYKMAKESKPKVKAPSKGKSHSDSPEVNSPVGRANRKQQGREVNEKKRKDKNFESRSNKNPNRGMKKHTPSRKGHKKY